MQPLLDSAKAYDRAASPAARLAAVRFLASASRPELEELAASVKRHSYAKGEVVYHQDDPPGNLFIVAKGMVKLQLMAPTGRSLTIGWVLPGDFFGTISLYGVPVRPENAVALEQSELLIVEREQLRAFLRGHPAATEAMLEVMARRWQRALEHLHDIAFRNAPNRIAKVLWEFSNRPGIASAEEQPLLRNLTQPELAALVNMTRESVNKWLHNFDRLGLIRLEHGSVRILQPAMLKRRIE